MRIIGFNIKLLSTFSDLVKKPFNGLFSDICYITNMLLKLSTGVFLGLAHGSINLCTKFQPGRFLNTKLIVKI